MDIFKADEILKKYDIYCESENEFKIKTAKDRGAVNVGLKLRICANFLDKQWRILRDKRLQLVKDRGICCDIERISLEKKYSHLECHFIFMTSQDICEPCRFYQENIKKINEDMQELVEASACFRKEADYDDTWR